MYKTETLIVLKNKGQINKFKSIWGVECSPVLNNGNTILPLGWEQELTDKNISFEVKEVEVYTEDLI